MQYWEIVAKNEIRCNVLQASKQNSVMPPLSYTETIVSSYLNHNPAAFLQLQTTTVLIEVYTISNHIMSISTHQSPLALMF